MLGMTNPGGGMMACHGKLRALAVLILMAAALGAASAARADDDLSYQNYSGMAGRPIACLYGYAADKTGDHKAAIAILEDCVAKGNVWSMIWLAMLYENGSGVPKNLAASAALMKRGAAMHDEAGYSTLARLHWGVALYEGRGVPRDQEAGIHWLTAAADEGDPDAAAYLRRVGR